jgi:CheY-like chemotaxis protein
VALRLAFAGRQQIVFVVEDDPDFRMAVGDLLAEEGLCPVLFSTAEKLLSSLDSEIPAAVVTDVVMPGMSGTQLLGVLRSHDRWRGIPVVVMTGNNDTALPIRLDAPIVYKPDMDGLVRALSTVLQRQPPATPMENVHGAAVALADHKPDPPGQH